MGKGFHSFIGPLTAALAIVRPLNVLEWGPGESTRIIRSNTFDGSRIITIEHDEKWFNRAVTEAAGDARVEVYRKDYQARDSDYATCALRFGSKFGVIFVDGRRRVECVLAGLEVLEPNGVMLLHDWSRENYRGLVGALPHAEVVWVQENTAFIKRVGGTYVGAG